MNSWYVPIFRDWNTCRLSETYTEKMEKTHLMRNGKAIEDLNVKCRFKEVTFVEKLPNKIFMDT